jgi:hypothetical protein
VLYLNWRLRYHPQYLFFDLICYFHKIDKYISYYLGLLERALLIICDFEVPNSSYGYLLFSGFYRAQLIPALAYEPFLLAKTFFLNSHNILFVTVVTILPHFVC